MRSEAGAIDIRKRAERRLGELMRDMPKAKGMVGKPGPGRGKRGSVSDPGFNEPPTLADHGIDKHLADRARKSAASGPMRFIGGLRSAIWSSVVHKAAAQDEEMTTSMFGYFGPNLDPNPLL